MTPFPTLDDFLLPAPLPAVVAVLVPLALLAIARDTMVRLRRSTTAVSAVEVAAAFVVCSGALGSAAFTLALLGQASIATLRGLGVVVVVYGLWCGASMRLTVLRRGVARFHGKLTNLSGLTRWAIAVSTVSLTGWTLTALGPPTEVDALDYHLGVPLEWLRHGAAHPRPDWLHAPFVGVGDGLNLLGLALGSDSLGAAFQAAGLVAAFVAVSSCGSSRRDRAFGVVLVAGCVAIGNLVPTPKPMMLPAAATTLAVVLIARNRAPIDANRLILVSACVAFAVGCKASFLLSGAVVLAWLAWLAWRSGRAAVAAVVIGSTLVLFAAPTYVANARFYGDPLWPFFERFRSDADPLAEGFAWYLRNFGIAPRSVWRYAMLPLELTVPLAPARITATLGLGTLAGALAWRDRSARRPLLVAAAAVAVLVLAFGQLSPRFFIEPYLWAAAAVVPTAWRVAKQVLFAALTAQTAVVAVLAGYGAIALFPGAWSADLRRQVMARAAPGAAVCQWMDATLPPDAVVASTLRAHALYPRPFLASDLARFMPLAKIDEEARAQRLAEALDRRRVDILVAREPVDAGPYAAVVDRLGPPVGEPATFLEATRNPLGRVRRFTVRAYTWEGNDLSVSRTSPGNGSRSRRCRSG